jgi:hypothetical protein
MIETMYDGQFGACAAVGPATNAAVKALLKHEGKTVSATISELEANLPEAVTSHGCAIRSSQFR